MEDHDFPQLKPKRAGRLRVSEGPEEDMPSKSRNRKHIHSDETIATSPRVATTATSNAEWDALRTNDPQPSGGCTISSNQMFVDSLALSDESEQTKVSAGSGDSVTFNPNPTIEGEGDDRAKQQGIAGLLRRLAPQGDIVVSQGTKSAEEAKARFDLKHYDKEGNLLTPKEAYKELSRKFHGTGLGKRRKEKQLLKKATERQQTESSRVCKPRRPPK